MGLEPLPPEHIEGADFPVALRGYDRREVDEFLGEVASQQRALLEELMEIKQSADNAYLDFGREVGRVLQQAKTSADQILSKAEEDSAKLREEANRTAQETVEKSRQQAEETRAAAERDALERIRDAQEKVQRLQETELEVRQRLQSWREMLRSMGEQIERAEAAPTVGSASQEARSPQEGDGLQPAAPEDRADTRTETDEGAGLTPAGELAQAGQAAGLRPPGERTQTDTGIDQPLRWSSSSERSQGDADVDPPRSWRPSGTEDASPNV